MIELDFLNSIDDNVKIYLLFIFINFIICKTYRYFSGDNEWSHILITLITSLASFIGTMVMFIFGIVLLVAFLIDSLKEKKQPGFIKIIKKIL